MTPPQMPLRTLGRTGISVSVVAFGAGPVSNLMTGADRARQFAVLRHAIDRGVNWIDTAATYGKGRSEESLGEALRQLADDGPGVDNAHAGEGRRGVHLATKVRLMPDELDDIAGAVRRSVEGSLTRLGVERVTLLQLHNAITAERGQEATSVTPRDVLGSGGVRESFRHLQQEGLIGHVGITAIGQAAPLREVVGSGEFDTIQVPYNVMNPSAGRDVPSGYREANYGNVIALAQRQNMGVFAIRVFAAGAVLEFPPAEHTKGSPFFTLDLYRRDVQRAAEMRRALGGRGELKDAAVRYTLQHPGVTSAIIGFGDPSHVDEAIASAVRGALPGDISREIETIALRSG